MSADAPRRLGRGLEALISTAKQQREPAVPSAEQQVPRKLRSAAQSASPTSRPIVSSRGEPSPSRSWPSSRRLSRRAVSSSPSPFESARRWLGARRRRASPSRRHPPRMDRDSGPRARLRRPHDAHPRARRESSARRSQSARRGGGLSTPDRRVRTDSAAGRRGGRQGPHDASQICCACSRSRRRPHHGGAGASDRRPRSRAAPDQGRASSARARQRDR